MIARSSSKSKASDKEDIDNMLALSGMESFIDWKGMSSSIASQSPTLGSAEFSPSDIISVASQEVNPLDPSSKGMNREKATTIKARKKSTNSMLSEYPDNTYLGRPNVPDSIIFSVPGDCSSTPISRVDRSFRHPALLQIQGRYLPVADATVSQSTPATSQKSKSTIFKSRMSDRDDDSVETSGSAEVRAKARSERKQARKKVKRQEINVKIEQLTSTMMKIENQDQEGDFNPPSNRVELMARTIVLLNNMHVENKKRKRDIYFMKVKLAEIKNLNYAVQTMERNNKARSLAQNRMNSVAKPQEHHLRRDSLGFPMQSIDPVSADYSNPYLNPRQQLFTEDNMLGQSFPNITHQEMQMQLEMQMKLQMQMQQLNTSALPSQYFAQQHQAPSIDPNFSALMQGSFNTLSGMPQDAFGLTANPSVSTANSLLGHNHLFDANQLAKLDPSQSSNKRRKMDLPYPEL